MTHSLYLNSNILTAQKLIIQISWNIKFYSNIKNFSFIRNTSQIKFALHKYIFIGYIELLI